jgi:hypothetical protein|tara:strand:+ start:10106 stop:11473 length:1368 start_codon:yes stop_codon:yes gene_type:complete
VGYSFQSLLGQALDDKDPHIAAACHPCAEPRDRQALEQILFTTIRSRRQLSRATQTPATVLHCLAADDNELIRGAVARNPSTAAASLVTLALNKGSVELAVGIVSHRHTPAFTLTDLYSQHSESAPARQALCRNPRTPSSVLCALVKRANATECKLIAGNPNAGEGLLRRFWEKGDSYLQAEVAAHSHCPSDLLNLARHSPQALVRRKMAGNPNVSDVQLISLLDDVAPPVRAAAVRHVTSLHIGQACLGDPSRLVRRDQARHGRLPLKWINTLSVDTDAWVRQLIARNETTPQQTLNSLANDPVMDVRRGVSRNLMCQPSLLAMLGGDPHPWVRAGVALRTDLPESLMEKLSQTDDVNVLSALGRNPMISCRFLERLIEHENKDIRRAVILNVRTPRRLLKELLVDPYPINRILLAGHPSLNQSDLSRLLSDPVSDVRFASATSLVARFCEELL